MRFGPEIDSPRLELIADGDRFDRAAVRFERVRRLLRETRLPLAEVARRSGFRTAEYLATAFRREFGVSPAAYRKTAGVTFSG